MRGAVADTHPPSLKEFQNFQNTEKALRLGAADLSTTARAICSRPWGGFLKRKPPESFEKHPRKISRERSRATSNNIQNDVKNRFQGGQGGSKSAPGRSQEGAQEGLGRTKIGPGGSQTGKSSFKVSGAAPGTSWDLPGPILARSWGPRRALKCLKIDAKTDPKNDVFPN